MTFQNHRDSENAMLKLNNTILDGREIRVSEQIIKDREDPRDGN